MYGRDITTGKLGNCRFGLWRDWNLTPIRGNPVDDDIDTKDLADHDESEFRRFLNDLQSSTEKVGA